MLAQGYLLAHPQRVQLLPRHNMKDDQKHHVLVFSKLSNINPDKDEK